MTDAETAMVPALICDRWRLMLPEYRAARHRDHPFWEKPRLDSMRANLGAGDVLHDVGTEDGDLSALFATWVDGYSAWDETSVKDGAGRLVTESRTPIGQRGGMVLIEPNSRVWPSIYSTWAANHLPEPLFTFHGFLSDRSAGPYAVASSPTWPDVARGRMEPAHGFSDLNEMVQARKQITSTTLDALAARTKRAPTAITIDCEGAEYQVLVGADRVLREDRPLVWVSIHPEMMAGYGTTPEGLVAYMATRGYRREHLAAEHEWHTLFWPEERSGVKLPYTTGVGTR